MTDVNQLIKDGQVAQAAGKDNAALDCFQQALLQHPDELSLQIACGNLCMKLNRFEEAAGHFRRMLSVNKNPDFCQALCYALQSLGNKADREGKYTLACAAFEEALEHQPNNAAHWYNLGNAQRELGHLEAAAISFQQSIKANPSDADTYNNLGNIQRELGQLDRAIESYRAALSINPNLHHALAHLIHQRQHVCDWHGEEDLAQQIRTVRAIVQNVPQAQISPFAFLAMPSTTTEEQKQCANHYVEQTYQHLYAVRDSLNFTHTIKARKKIKVAYLSADFRLHPLAFLMTELVESHDRNQFEITAYSYGADDQTDTRKRLEEAFDHFVDIRGLNDLEAATKINQDNTDILVDLTGYTQSSRTGIVALRPAALHISWLGFPGTMGAYQNSSLFDYILADKTVANKPSDFTEKLLYLPCYQPNSQRKTGPVTQKHEHFLPSDSFVFCSFNQTFKITENIFSIWLRLIKQVPNSVLWLLECNPWAKNNLQQAAELSGVDSNRLIFAKRADSKAHIERQRHADLFLDTLPYNAHTTASDALWAGLPILTCKGETFSASVAASLLSYVGLPSLICDTLEEYEEKALYFAKKPDSLKPIKNQLCNTIKTSDLFNSEKFARLLETQYHAVWQDLQ